MSEIFRTFARVTGDLIGSPWVFGLALVALVVWPAFGPHYGYSETWRRVITTGTGVVTFLMVLLLQNAQSRDAKAIHLKLDELLRGVQGARTGLMGLEQLSEAELLKLQEEFTRLQARAPAVQV
ncbi:MAG TPA: low affinity iron permease family protein [Terriglobales bacterium]|nr:low affinity iron permease family protein [Terriglobales bacterium]